MEKQMQGQTNPILQDPSSYYTSVQNWNEYHFYWDIYLVRACSLIENFQAFAAVWSYPLSF